MELPSIRRADFHPCIDPDILKETLSYEQLTSAPSLVFTKNGNGYRQDVLTGKLDPSACFVDPESQWPENPSIPQEAIRFGARFCGRAFDEDDESTVLHYAAFNGDLLLAIEAIRLGADVHRCNKHGQTPLMVAVEQVSLHTHIYSLAMNTQLEIGWSLCPVADPAKALVAQNWRCVKVAILFLQQHANPNIVYKGRTPLSVACQIPHWELIEALLEHGANPDLSDGGRLIDMFPDTKDKRRLRGLLNGITQKARPPRRCPCLRDGKSLAECHGAQAQPYPLSFLCLCHSGKTYGKCCKRKVLIQEQWSEEEQRIQATSRYTLDYTFCQINDELIDVLCAFQECWRSKKEEDPLLAMIVQSSVIRHIALIHDNLAVSHQADAGYLYAMKKLPFVFMPHDRALPKRICENLMSQWNAKIDEYITSGRGSDARPALEVERACKLAADGGPLFKSCGAQGCTRVEHIEGTVLKYCTGCLRIKYCSSACQRRHWSTHKPSCTSRKHPAEMLPSQQACRMQLEMLLVDCLKKIKAMGNIEEAFRGDAREAAGVIMVTGTLMQGLNSATHSGSSI